MRGIVTGITDHGTVVTMEVEQTNGAVQLVHFDHRVFWGMVEMEREPTRLGWLVGREVEVRVWDGEQHVEFDPDPKWADVERDQVAP